MISKAKYIETCLLRSDESLKNDTEIIASAIARYDELVKNKSEDRHVRAMSIIADAYIRRHTALKNYGNGVNPVWAKEEIENLRSIWDSFDLLRKITMQNTEGHEEIWHIGQRP